MAKKYDVELEGIRTRYALHIRIVDGIMRVLTIASFSIPLYMVYLTVDTLAGRATIIEGKAIAWLVAAMVGGPSALGNAFLGWKTYRQRRELVRLREFRQQHERSIFESSDANIGR